MALGFKPFRFLRSPHTIKGLVLLGVVGIVCVAVRSYQTNEVELEARTLLKAHEYEAAIAVLNEHTEKHFDASVAEHLAHLLTTTPRLKARNYEQAITLSKRVIDSTYSTELKAKAIDTLACAYFANRDEVTAKEIAVKNHLTNRIDQFAIGRPCQEFTPAEAQRMIASEKEK